LQGDEFEFLLVVETTKSSGISRTMLFPPYYLIIWELSGAGNCTYLGRKKSNEIYTVCQMWTKQVSYHQAE
jgi:hypothetical protein